MRNLMHNQGQALKRTQKEKQLDGGQQRSIKDSCEYRHMHMIIPGTNANVLVAVKSKVCLLFEMKRKTIKFEQAFNPPLNIKRPL